MTLLASSARHRCVNAALLRQVHHPCKRRPVSTGTQRFDEGEKRIKEQYADSLFDGFSEPSAAPFKSFDSKWKKTRPSGVPYTLPSPSSRTSSWARSVCPVFAESPASMPRATGPPASLEPCRAPHIENTESARPKRHEADVPAVPAKGGRRLKEGGVQGFDVYGIAPRI